MFKKGFRYVFMDEAGAGEGGGAGAGQAGTDGAGTGAAAAGADGGQAGAGGAGDGGAGQGTAAQSVLAGAAAGTEGQQQQQQTVTIPEKYQVKKEDGSIDIEASSLKLAEAYGHLEKRFGSGDVPPKSAEEYQITVPDAFKDVWKPEEDQAFQDFRKDALAAGMTQKQFDLVMDRYFKVAPQLVEGSKRLSADECIADLRQEWKDDQTFNAELGKAFKAAVAYGGNDAEALIQEYGSDPRFIRMMNRIGGELGEDSSINPGDVLANGQSIESVMQSEAYTNPKHPDHAKVSKQVSDYWAKKAEADARAGNVPIL